MDGNKKKILAVFTNTTAGLYIFRNELLSSLSENYDIRVLSTNTGRIKDLEKIGCRITEIKMDKRGANPFKDMQLMRVYKKFIRETKPSYVINYTIKPDIYGGIVCRKCGIPYSNNITGLGTAFDRGGLLQKIVEFLYKKGCKKAVTVFFENSGNAEVFLSKKLITPEQAVVLNGAGVNLTRFSFTEYPEDDSVTHFLFMGRIMKEKGIEELFEAAERLHKNNFAFSLDVLGSYVEDYKPLIDKYTEQGWLHYYGFQKDVKPFIEKCNCFVLPSWHEGMANTNLESAAMGRPVITSNIPGCREAVINGESGLLCERQNADDLYEKLVEFIQLPYEQKRIMGVKGRKHVENCFDKVKVVKNTIDALHLN